MRRWKPAPPAPPSLPPAAHGGGIGDVLGVMVRSLGERGFGPAVLHALQPLLPAASWSVYRIGPRCRPELFLSATQGIPDTTRECWRAYLSGPHLHDRSWSVPEAGSAPSLCHVTADEIGGEHKVRVYDAHGMAERLSIVEADDDDASLFAVNFYRHRHQRLLRDAQIADFGVLAPALIELVRKQIALTRPTVVRVPASPIEPDAPLTGPAPPPSLLRARLIALHDGFTPRELEVCVRLLQGMTHEGIACDLQLSAATVKTYRNRAFARLGIHFRNELFALALGVQSPD